MSEFTIVNAAVGSGQFLASALFLVLLFVAFIGMGMTVLGAVQGVPQENAAGSAYRDSIGTGGPVLLCMALVLLLGVYIPPPLSSLLHDAARFLEANP